MKLKQIKSWVTSLIRNLYGGNKTQNSGQTQHTKLSCKAGAVWVCTDYTDKKKFNFLGGLHRVNAIYLYFINLSE